MIKKMLGLVLVGMMAVGVAVSFAGGCCMEGAKAGGCTDAFSKLNLTLHQKAEIETLHHQCEIATSTSEARQLFADGIVKILTPAQLTQWKAQKSDKADGGCPFMKAHADAKS